MHTPGSMEIEAQVPGQVVDLRSDTFTAPDAGMRAAMAGADVGDDVWGEDPTVRALEDAIARRLRKEAAVFVPSGTMGNLTSIAAQTRPGDEVIADAYAHVVVNESAGAAVVAGVQLRMLDGFEGVPDAVALAASIREKDDHFPISRLFCVENTHNRRGGAAIHPDRIRACAELAHARGLRVHCDGARLFNAAVALECDPAELVDTCDTVSVCFSKGLGAPVGSAVAGDAAVISEIRRWRKRLGGGMRQAGILAAGALYALTHNVARLAEDHEHARSLVAALGGAAHASVLTPSVPTNIVVVETATAATDVARDAAARGVLVSVTGTTAIRCVTHLGVTGDDCHRAAEVLCAVLEGR